MLLSVANTNPNYTPSIGCPEVSNLREELVSVKTTLQGLRDFVKNTRTAQADASIDLIQRIAAKLDLLTENEKQLIAAQDLFRKTINIETSTKPHSEDSEKPKIVRAEQPNVKPPKQVTDQDSESSPQTSESNPSTDTEIEQPLVAPSVLKQDTTDQTTAQPTTAQPTTAQPTTAQPTTAQPTTAQPTTAQPTTAQPTTAQPTAAESTTSEVGVLRLAIEEEKGDSEQSDLRG